MQVGVEASRVPEKGAPLCIERRPAGSNTVVGNCAHLLYETRYDEARNGMVRVPRA